MTAAQVLVFVVEATRGHHVAREYVVDLATGLGSDVHVVHVGLDSPRTTPTPLNPTQRERMHAQAEKVAAAEVERLAELGVDRVSTHVRLGDPARHVLAVADELDADLIVIGDRADGRLLQALVGDRPATRLARRSPCSVLVAKEGRR